MKSSGLHRWFAVGWMIPGIFVMWFACYVLPQPHGLFLIGVISLWANTASHWSAYEGARAKEQTAQSNSEVSS